MPISPKLSDLIVAVAARDRLAFRHLYDATAGHLKAVAFHLVGREDEAEHVLLETYEQVWRGASTYRPDEADPLAWLLHLVRTKALDLPRGAGATAASAFPAEGKGAIWNELARLGEERESLLHAYRDGWSYSRLAQESRTSPEVARDLVLRALQGLGADDDDELLVAEAVVGALDRAPRQEMERRCRVDPRLGAVQARWSARLAPLALTLPSMTPSATLWPRITAVTGAVAELPVPKTTLAPKRLPVIRRGRGARRWLYLTAASATVLLGLVIYAVTGGSSFSEIEAVNAPWQAAPAASTSGPARPAD